VQSAWLTRWCRLFQGPSGEREDNHLEPGWDYRLDFSTCFEDVVLMLIPLAFLLVAGGLRALLLHSTQRVSSPSSPLYQWKQIMVAFLAAGMLGKMLTAIYLEQYDFRVVSPALQSLAYVSRLRASSPPIDHMSISAKAQRASRHPPPCSFGFWWA
jgi:hypothetical protein